MMEVKELYGLVVIERQEATIGLLVGKKIKVLQKMDSMIPGKTNKGGQSAARYSRIRDNMAKEFFRKIAIVMKGEFFDLKGLKGILVGGPGPTKEDFLKQGELVTALKDKVLAVKDIGYADEHGLELLVGASGDVLAEQEIFHEKKILENFFNMLGKEKDMTAYKEKDIEKALSYGAVDTLILSRKLKKDEISKHEKKAAETGVKVLLVSVDTPEGQQFWNLGGVGAILRFKVQ
jgi:peptide chain release factor subunit 1